MKTPNPKLQELENNYKRALADYQNLEKRVAAQRADDVRFAVHNFASALLPVLDNLERANMHLADKGIEMIINQFLAALKAEGISEINSTNTEFNPELMDCINLVPGPKDQVVNTVEKGYLLHDRVLRHAKVEVGAGVLDQVQDDKHSN